MKTKYKLFIAAASILAGAAFIQAEESATVDTTATQTATKDTKRTDILLHSGKDFTIYGLILDKGVNKKIALPTGETPEKIAISHPNIIKTTYENGTINLETVNCGTTNIVIQTQGQESYIMMVQVIKNEAERTNFTNRFTEIAKNFSGAPTR
jgi:hypothetical protein